MDSFGAYLKSAREEKGRTLEDISESTKVAVANLEFLENDRFDLLPPRVFVKGFIRAYAQEVGLNPAEAVAKFDAFARQGELPDYDEQDEYIGSSEVAPVTSFIHNRWFTIALTTAGLISLVILAATGVTRLFFPDDTEQYQHPTGEARQVASTSIAVKTPAESDQMARKSAFAEPPRRQQGKKVLEIKAVANAWIRVEPDTGAPEELVMAPGDIQVFTAQESFHILTGNAGGIRIRYDGKEYPVL
ncbi:MAG: helix-turn-helix domain-containing protein, partial [Desulfomonilaceae bacterium]